MSRKLVEVRVTEREERLVERAYYVMVREDEMDILEGAVKDGAFAPYAADDKCHTISSRVDSVSVATVHGVRPLEEHAIPQSLIIE